MTEEAEFLERLSSFDAVKWLGHSKAASPLICARYGWTNISFQVLKCLTCRVTFPFSISREISDLKEEDVKETLMNQHSIHCIWRTRIHPSHFEKIKLEPLEVVSKNFLKRFDGYRLLWDLPEMDDVTADATVKEDLQLLFSFLHDRLCGSLTVTDRHRWEKALENRVQLVMTLTLLGWSLKWLPKVIYMEPSSDRPFHFTEGMENEPTLTGICYGRQSYLVCHLCNAKMGLWSVSTAIDLEMDTFKEIAEKLDRTKEAPLIGLKRKREEEERLRTEAMLHPSVDRPAFGLRNFKKTPASVFPSLSLPSSNPLSRTSAVGDPSMGCRPVLTDRKLDPIESHRHFCPYTTQWMDMLKALTCG